MGGCYIWYRGEGTGRGRNPTGLVVLKSGLGLKSGLKSTFARLGHGLGGFFSKSSDKSTSYKVINRQY